MENLNKQECIKVLHQMGFAPSKTLGGDLHKDFEGFDCMLWIDDNSISLKVYGKSAPFSDTGYISPLPDEQKLRAFIKYNAG